MRRTKAIVKLVALCGIVTLTPATTAAAGAAATGITGPAAAVAPVASRSAAAIVLERSGGFAGGRDIFTVNRGTVGGHRPLRMAGSSEFRALRGSYRPANACCDRYSYRLTVSYRDGHRRTVSAVQGADAPKILWDVIAEVQRVGVRGGAGPLSVPPERTAGR